MYTAVFLSCLLRLARCMGMRMCDAIGRHCPDSCPLCSLMIGAQRPLCTWLSRCRRQVRCSHCATLALSKLVTVTQARFYPHTGFGSKAGLECAAADGAAPRNTLLRLESVERVFCSQTLAATPAPPAGVH